MCGSSYTKLNRLWQALSRSHTPIIPPTANISSYTVNARSRLLTTRLFVMNRLRLLCLRQMVFSVPRMLSQRVSSKTLLRWYVPPGHHATPGQSMLKGVSNDSAEYEVTVLAREPKPTHSRHLSKSSEIFASICFHFHGISSPAPATVPPVLPFGRI